MADKKISQLTELTTAADDDSLVILDKDADVTKRIEVSNLVGTNELLLKTASTLTSSPQAVRSVGDEVSALQISSVGVKSAGTLTATGTSTLASATLSGDLTIGTGETVDTILDEDTMSSDDPNALATQQSIKAYIDGKSHESGTVTSIDVSGGSTGLSTSGGPITTSGTITLAGEVNETTGGTGTSTYATGDILYASGTNTLSKLTMGASDTYLGNVAGIPAWIAEPIGTVTSVDVSGGTTGLTTSGGPVTGSGTVTLAGTVATTNGGTGLTAIGVAGQVLTVNSGETALEYTTLSGSGTVTSVTAGNGMTQSGTSTINPTLDVVGTADRITASADAIDIASTYVGQTSITTLGTVATGTWEGTAVAATKGGTGQTVYAVGDILYANTTTTLTPLVVGSDDDVLTLASGIPSWAAAAGGGNVSNSGTPVDNQLAIWTGATTIEGDADLVFDGTKLGIGIQTPPNNLSVSPVQYSTGTASAASGVTIEGSGTTWDSTMVGSEFVFADGTSGGAIVSVTDADTLTVTTDNGTVASQAYKIHYQGLQVDSSGDVGIGTAVADGRLHVKGVSSGTDAVLIEGTSFPQINFHDGTAVRQAIWLDTSSSNTLTIGNGSSGEGILVDTAGDTEFGGNVGIGRYATGGTTVLDVYKASGDTYSRTEVGAAAYVGSAYKNTEEEWKSWCSNTGKYELYNNGTTTATWLSIDPTSGTASQDGRMRGPAAGAEICIACSDETTEINSTGVKATFLIPRAMTVTTVKLSLTAAEISALTLQVVDYADDPTGGSGTTDMLNTDLSSSTWFFATATSFDGAATSYSLDENDFVAVNVTSEGDSQAKGLKVWLLGYWT